MAISDILHYIRQNETFKYLKTLLSSSYLEEKMTDPEEFLFPVGSFIRRYSMDEFPQLFSIIIVLKSRSPSFILP